MNTGCEREIVTGQSCRSLGSTVAASPCKELVDTRLATGCKREQRSPFLNQLYPIGNDNGVLK